MAQSEKTEAEIAEKNAGDMANYKKMRVKMDLPKANLVRINVLTPEERQKYLGSIDRKSTRLNSSH